MCDRCNSIVSLSFRKFWFLCLLFCVSIVRRQRKSNEHWTLEYGCLRHLAMMSSKKKAISFFYLLLKMTTISCVCVCACNNLFELCYHEWTTKSDVKCIHIFFFINLRSMSADSGTLPVRTMNGIFCMKIILFFFCSRSVEFCWQFCIGCCVWAFPIRSATVLQIYEYS